ncbi:hypothetical protein HK102_002349, partial [Quaeritorhiza haematococci]
GWPRWDVDLEESALDEPEGGAVEGATGHVVMKKRGKFAFTLRDLDPEANFGYETNVPGASAYWYWSWDVVSKDQKGFWLEEGVIFEGLAAPAYKLWLEKQCIAAFDTALANIKRLVENGEMAKANAPRSAPLLSFDKLLPAGDEADAVHVESDEKTDVAPPLVW